MRRTEVLQGIRLMKFSEILGRTRSRELSQGEAASVLGVSERTFRRWRERYDAEGAEGLPVTPPRTASGQTPESWGSPPHRARTERLYLSGICSWSNDGSQADGGDDSP